VEPEPPGEPIDVGLIYWCLARLPGTLPARPPDLTFRQAMMLMADRSEKPKASGMSWQQARIWALERQAAKERDPWGVGTNGKG
jgi:hypothetical protein